MARSEIAPWADLVPIAGPTTASDLLAMGDADWGYELVSGVLVKTTGKLARTALQGGVVSTQLLIALHKYVHGHELGAELQAQTGYLLSRPGEPDTVLAPSVAFIHADRIPPADTRDESKYLALAPDLVAEVAAPSQPEHQLAAKACLFLASGVRLVWIIWPEQQTVDVWRPGSDSPVATLAVGDTLDGFDVVPGFSYPIVDLFS